MPIINMFLFLFLYFIQIASTTIKQGSMICGSKVFLRET